MTLSDDGHLYILGQLNGPLQFSLFMQAHRSTKQINDKYRVLRDDLRHVMTTGLREEFPREILEERKRRIEGLAVTIKTMVPDGELQDYLRSLIHMTMNRLFRSQNRLCEMMVLEYLGREYTTLLKNRR